MPAGRGGRWPRVPTGAVYLLGLVPLVLLVAGALADGLGADPAKRIEHAFGTAAVQFLIATLAVTPLRRLAGINLMRWRRGLGLVAFAYGVAHLGVWVVLDIQLRWDEIARDLSRRPYVIFGMAALVALLPLALTSTDGAIRRLGALRWRRLHLLVHPAAILVALHVVAQAKVWAAEPVAYAAALVLLVAFRLVPQGRGRRLEARAAPRRPDPGGRL
jgi:sulfoxide reductase heme-binding subunit YedZ